MSYCGKNHHGRLDRRTQSAGCQASRRLAIRSAQMAVHEHQLMHDLLGYYRDETGNASTTLVF
jgi:hypothetical protein